jgi:hypothetical protein
MSACVVLGRFGPKDALVGSGGTIMRKPSLLRTVSVGMVGLCLAFGSAAAQGKGHKDHERDHDRNHVREQYRVPPGLARQGRIPPGLAKKGGLPPGQAKKLYRSDDGVAALRDAFGRHGYTVVRTTNSGNARYVYYRLRDGSVRRAIVTPGSERLRFQNVPDALVREIYARLY